MRDGGDRHGNLLNIALAGLGGRDDRFCDDGDSQGEGHRDPFARPHAHGATRRSNPVSSAEDLVVAFGKVWKREVSGRARVAARSTVTPRIATRAPGNGAPVWS